MSLLKNVVVESSKFIFKATVKNMVCNNRCIKKRWRLSSQFIKGHQYVLALLPTKVKIQLVFNILDQC